MGMSLLQAVVAAGYEVAGSSRDNNVVVTSITGTTVLVKMVQDGISPWRYTYVVSARNFTTDAEDLQQVLGILYRMGEVVQLLDDVKTRVR